MSTAVAFHFNAPNKLVYACKLVRKLQRMSMPLVVLGEQVTLDALDKSLWTFGGEAQFLAHCQGDAAPEVLQRSPTSDGVPTLRKAMRLSAAIWC